VGCEIKQDVIQRGDVREADSADASLYNNDNNNNNNDNSEV
jgi:hypothetical protein